MIQGVPDLLIFWGLLASEKLLAVVKPQQWILLVIEHGKRQLVDVQLED
jgi:hypothetical protein